MKSIRKSIALFLAFTMLTIPLAGCSRTVTTGGFSGRGILGDFLIGGFYGGFLGGFLCPGEELPEGTFVLELPRANDARLVTEAVGMDALRYYVHARIATEKLSRANKDNMKAGDYEKLLRETADLWRLAHFFTDAASQFSARLMEMEKKPGYKPLAMTTPTRVSSPFFSVAFAEGVTAKRGTKEWAQEIAAAYERFPAGKGIQGLSNQLNIDAKKANEEFQEAIKILDSGNKTKATLYNIGAKTALVTKGACQTGLLVGGAILSGGATGAAGVAAAVNTAAAGVDWVIEISNISHELLTDQSNPMLDKIKKWTGPISAVTSGVTIITSFKGFALTGQEAIEATQKSLKEAGLNPYGLLDKCNLAGTGVAAICDSVVWTTERVLEYYEDGTFLGFQIRKKDDGKNVVVPVDMGQGVYGPPTPLDQIDVEELKILFDQSETEARLETIKELSKLVENLDKKKHDILQNEAQRAQKETESLLQKEASRIKEIIEEDAKRRREIAEDEARREKERRQEKPEAKEYARDPRFPAYVPHPSVSNDMGGGAPSNNMGGGTAGKTEQQRPEEPSYTPSRMAGYYTVTTAKGDMAMRVVLKATGENTLRVIEVQQRSDKKGKGKYTITIDPKTGKGKTDKGNTVRFEVKRDGVTFMGTLEDGSRIWRFVKH